MDIPLTVAHAHEVTNVIWIDRNVIDKLELGLTCVQIKIYIY